METLSILQIIWFFLIGILFAGYAVLDGFDLGIGALLPFLSKSDEQKTKTLFNAIGPVWDGNEVWLITAGGALFAAFPDAYATVFSGFYLALMILLVGLILRAISIEFFTLDTKNRKLWTATFFIGSLIPSLLFGVALGNVILGIPLDSAMEFRGNFFTLLRPFPLMTGLLGLSAILMQGSTFAALKTEGELNSDAKILSMKIWYFYATLFVITLTGSFIFMSDRMNSIPAWLFTALFVASIVALKKYLSSGDELKSFLSSSLAFISLWGIAGSIQFPALVKSSSNSALDITLYNASSSQLTLSVMLGITLVGMPLVIAYTAYVYRVYKGKVKI